MQTAELYKKTKLKGTKFPIYLDYQATAPMDRRVLEKMLPFFTDKFGNPHSKTHKFGWEAEQAVDIARNEIAKLINAESKEIVFTSGATESNNLAIKGVCGFYKDKNHIITLPTEHKCVLSTLRHLEQEKGIKVTYLPVESNGIIDLNKLENAITSDTLLVSIMAVNNEIGVIQPLERIGAICKKRGVLFHSDIAQGFGKIEIDVQKFNIDLASISGHKIYGPKGIGALYVRRNPRVRLIPIIDGGGQESGMRSGTLPTPLIVGFGEAARIASNEMTRNYQYIKTLYDYFVDSILSSISESYLNGDRKKRFPGNVNISFAYVEGESLILAIKDLAVSSGSACTSSSLAPSYVIRSIGVDESLAHTSIRFGFSHLTKREEVEYAILLLQEKVKSLRDLSPLWEMAQEGIDVKKIEWV